MKLYALSLNGREKLDSGEAEAKARQFIKQRHSRVERIFFRTMYREGNTWILHGELKFKRAHFFHATRSSKIKIDAITGEIVSYEETKVPKTKEAK
jgi:hypothetical protein